MSSLDQRVKEIFEEWESRQAQGEAISLAELAGDDLELAARLRATQCLRTAVHQKPISHDSQKQALDATTELSKDSSPADQVRSNLHPEGMKNSHVQVAGYEILNEVARGGMGVVFRARHEKLGRTVALKMVLGRNLASSDAVQRFLVEAKAAAQLSHAGIVPVYEIGESDGQYFFTMAFVEGGSLDGRLKEEGPLPSRDAAALVKQVAEAVHYAHEAGVVHRDLKPGNILLDTNGHPKVTDFGLAKRTTDDSELTATGDILGTPSYMAPEQADGRMKQSGPLIDVYALGAVLYATLAGRPPFMAASLGETLRQVAEVIPISPRMLNPSIDRDLETICLKCLEKDPARRYASAQALADDLGRYLRNEPILAKPVSSAARLIRWCKRNPAVASLVSVAALLLVGVAIISTVAYFRESHLNSVAVAQTKLANDRKKLAEANELRAKNEATRAQKAEQRAESERSKAAQEAKAARAAERVATDAQQQAQRESEAAKQAAYIHQLGLAQRELEVGNISRFNEVVNQVETDRRGWEWSFLSRLQSPIRHINGIGNVTAGVVVSNDGKWIAVGNRSGEVVIWEYPSWKKVATLTNQSSTIWQLRFDVNGHWLAVCDYGSPPRCVIYETATWKTIQAIVLEQGMVGAAVSPNGKWLAATVAMTAVRIFDTSTWEVYREIPLKLGAVYSGTSLAFSPDSKRLAIPNAFGKPIVLWDVETNLQVEREFDRIGHIRDDLYFTPDEETIIGSDQDGKVRAWNVETGKGLYAVHSQPQHANGAISPDGKLYATACWNTLAVHEIASGKFVRRFREIRGDNYQVPFFTPDGKYVGVGGRGCLVLFPLDIPDESQTHRIWHTRIDSARFSDCGRYAWIATDGRFALWSVASQVWLWEVRHPKLGFLTATTLSTDGNYVYWLTKSQELEQVECATGRIVQTWKTALPADSQSMQVTFQGDVIVMTPQGKVLSRKVATGETNWEHQLPADKNTHLVLDEARDRCIILNGRQTLLLQISSGEVVRSRKTPSLYELRPAFSPNGETLAMISDSGASDFPYLRIESLADKQEILRTAIPGSRPTTICWNSDASRLFTAGADCIVSVWSPTSKQPLLELVANDEVKALKILNDGRLMAVLKNGEVQTWQGSGFLSKEDGALVEILPHLKDDQFTNGAPWKKTEDGIRADGARYPRLETSVKPRGSYRLRVDFTRHSVRTNGMFAVRLPVAGYGVEMHLDQGGHSGIGSIEGVGVGPQNPTVLPSKLVNGQRYILEIAVTITGERARIESWLEGAEPRKKLVEWQGNKSSLTVYEGWAANVSQVGLTGGDNDLTIHSLQFETTDGRTDWIPNIRPKPMPGWDAVEVEEPIDLISLLPQLPVPIVGKAERTDDGLTISGPANARLPLPIITRGDYEWRSKIELVSTTRNSREAASFQFTLGSTVATVLLDAQFFNRRAVGIEMVDGKGIGNTENYEHKAEMMPLQPGKRYDVLLRVAQLSDKDFKVEVELDGNLILKWNGNSASITTFQERVIPAPLSFSIGTSDSKIILHQSELVMKTGEAWVKPADEMPGSAEAATTTPDKVEPK